MTPRRPGPLGTLLALLACSSSTAPPSPTAGAGGGPDETGGSGAARPGGSGGRDIGPGTADASPTVDAAVPLPVDAAAAPAGSCAQIFNQGAPSAWVYYDASGKLAYKTIDEHGDRIMDF